MRCVFPEVVEYAPKVFRDDRGWFVEAYNPAALAKAGIVAGFMQDNHSYSVSVGTVRGLHYQLAPTEQAKLVRVARGRILDVVVDIRRGSPTFGRHMAVELSAAGFQQIFVPHGFAHGFVTLEPDTEVLYKVDAPYDPARERGILWNDPDLGIEWPLPSEGAVLSAKDIVHPRLADQPDLPIYRG